MVKFICVCKFCVHHDSEESTVEINFRDNKIIYYCPHCKKKNELDLSPKEIGGYPKARRLGG